MTGRGGIRGQTSIRKIERNFNIPQQIVSGNFSNFFIRVTVARKNVDDVKRDQ